MKLLSSLLLSVCSLLLFSHVSAAPTLQAFGVNGSTAVFDCAWNQAHTACPWTGFTNYTGTTNASATSVTSVDKDVRGEARVSGEISATSYLPTLHAFARSNPLSSGALGTPYGGSARADANVWGVQGYKYVGDTPFLLTVSATLDSIFSRPDSDRQGNHSGFNVSIFDVSGYAFAYNSLDAEYSPEVCPLFLAAPAHGYCAGMPTVYAFDRQILRDSGTVNSTISYLLTPGKEFYVGAFLDASVCCGAMVDSSHTLQLQFNDASLLDSRLVPGLVAAVPEPNSILLMAMGLAVFFWSRRARRHAERDRTVHRQATPHRGVTLLLINAGTSHATSARTG